MADLQALRLAFLDASAKASADPGHIPQAWTDARAAYHSALAAEPPLWDDATPALLTPVRLEVRYLPGSGAGTAPLLAIRVIPDDIARYSFEPDLTPAEHAAGHQYWDTVAAPGADADAAWALVLAQLGDARGAWAVELTRRDSAVADPGTRTGTRPATSLLLPDKFTFRCWRDRQLLFEKDGNPIRAGLCLGPDFSQLGADHKPTTAGALAWTDNSRWMVDFDDAVDAGMAVAIPLTGTDLAFDAVTVIGASSCSPAEGTDRLARTLQGHLYTDGLGYPPVGSPTNNTDATRSQWSTHPVLRTPDEVSAAVAAAHPGVGQPGVALADALGMGPEVRPGIAGRRDLLATADATSRNDEDDDDHPARRAHQLMADYQVVLTTPGAAPDPRTWLSTAARASHFTSHVRAEGPLPVLRVGRQPYGVLPVTSLAAWAPSADPELPEDLVTQILLRAAQLDASLGLSPHLSADPDQDQDPVLLGLWQRQPATVAVRAMQSTFSLNLLAAMSAPFDPTPSDPPDPASPPTWPLAAMATTAQGDPAAAEKNGFFPAAVGLSDLCHHNGLYWAVQAYAALRVANRLDHGPRDDPRHGELGPVGSAQRRYLHHHEPAAGPGGHRQRPPGLGRRAAGRRGDGAHLPAGLLGHLGGHRPATQPTQHRIHRRSPGHVRLARRRRTPGPRGAGRRVGLGADPVGPACGHRVGAVRRRAGPLVDRVRHRPQLGAGPGGTHPAGRTAQRLHPGRSPGLPTRTRAARQSPRRCDRPAARRITRCRWPRRPPAVPTPPAPSGWSSTATRCAVTPLPPTPRPPTPRPSS